MTPYGKTFGNLTPANRSALQRKEMADAILAKWAATQGAKILEARGKPIHAFCKMEAKDRAQYLSWYEDAPRLMLDLESIDECEARALSQARMTQYGPGALRQHDKGERWEREMVSVRATVRAGIWPEGRA